jgi:hypothetical protein
MPVCPMLRAPPAVRVASSGSISIVSPERSVTAIFRIDDLPLPPIALVKMDIQGAEAVALAGMRDLLARSSIRTVKARSPPWPDPARPMPVCPMLRAPPAVTLEATLTAGGALNIGHTGIGRAGSGHGGDLAFTGRIRPGRCRYARC